MWIIKIQRILAFNKGYELLDTAVSFERRVDADEYCNALNQIEKEGGSSLRYVRIHS